MYIIKGVNVKKITHFPSVGKNVKIWENSEKIRGPPGSRRDPLQPFLGP